MMKSHVCPSLPVAQTTKCPQYDDDDDEKPI